MTAARTSGWVTQPTVWPVEAAVDWPTTMVSD